MLRHAAGVLPQFGHGGRFPIACAQEWAVTGAGDEPRAIAGFEPPERVEVHVVVVIVADQDNVDSRQPIEQYARRVNAIWFPSGDQEGSSAVPETRVRRVVVPRAAT